MANKNVVPLTIYFPRRSDAREFAKGTNGRYKPVDLKDSPSANGSRWGAVRVA